ncbi:MAG: RHS repeat protein, partial [Bacteroidetes bacterium]|nr:RHS repeat protein [Bacteroidota bacterium]
MFAAPTGYFGTLTKEQDGSYILRETNGFKRTYDEQGQLRSLRERTGNTIVLGYNGLGRLVTVQDTFDRTIEFRYDNRGRIDE